MLPYATLTTSSRPSPGPFFNSVCTESLCKSPHLGDWGANQRLILHVKEAAQEVNHKRRPALRAESLGMERPQGGLQGPDCSHQGAGETGCGGIPGSGLCAGAEGALGPPHLVQHFQGELNTRLLGQLCWNSRSPAQLW